MVGRLRALRLKIHLLSKNLQSKQREPGLLNETPRNLQDYRKNRIKKSIVGPN